LSVEYRKMKSYEARSSLPRYWHKPLNQSLVNFRLVGQSWGDCHSIQHEDLVLAPQIHELLRLYLASFLPLVSQLLSAHLYLGYARYGIWGGGKKLCGAVVTEKGSFKPSCIPKLSGTPFECPQPQRSPRVLRSGGEPSHGYRTLGTEHPARTLQLPLLAQ